MSRILIFAPREVSLLSGAFKLDRLKSKMQAYLTNGVTLAWLIDPNQQQTFIHRPGQEPEMINDFQESLKGEGQMEGLVLRLRKFLD